MQMFGERIDGETPELHEEGVRMRFVGRREGVPQALAEKMDWAEQTTRDNTRITLFVAFNYGNVALARYLTGNYEEAVRQSQAAVRLRPGYGSAYRLLAASAGMAGQTEIATAALQDLRRVQPNASLEWIKAYVPLKNDADLSHYLEGFRRAGLE